MCFAAVKYRSVGFSSTATRTSMKDSIVVNLCVWL